MSEQAVALASCLNNRYTAGWVERVSIQLYDPPFLILKLRFSEIYKVLGFQVYFLGGEGV